MARTSGRGTVRAARLRLASCTRTVTGMRALRRIERSTEALARRAEEQIAACLARGDSPAEAAALAGRLLDEAVDAASLRAVSLAPACSAGCAWCCHVHVDASAPEIQAVVAHLRATRSEDEVRALSARLAEAARRVEALDDVARWEARIPCALLDEAGRCSVHPGRPLRCRAFHSCSAEACRAAFEGAPDADALPLASRAMARAARAVEEGFERALIAAGIDVEPQRLEAGLSAALAERSPRA